MLVNTSLRSPRITPSASLVIGSNAGSSSASNDRIAQEMMALM